MEDDICLCDCPGLVFPTFVNTKAEMVCNGILPIDQLRDPIPPVAMVRGKNNLLFGVLLCENK